MSNKNIAVIFEGDVRQRLGVFNAVIQRALHLQAVSNHTLSIHMIQFYDGWLMSRLRHSDKVKEMPQEINIDGLTIHMHWFKRSFIDAIAHRILRCDAPCFARFAKNLASRLKRFDVVVAHDRFAGEVAVKVKNIRNSHCFITWHGTSIHTEPLNDSAIWRKTKQLLQKADMNFFVSRGLEQKAREVFPDAEFQSDTLLNGASPEFFRFSPGERAALREKFDVSDKKVVTFVGRFSPVKNVTLLPEIFHRINEKHVELTAERSDGDSDKIEFWTIGDGELLPQVKELMAQAGVNCRFWGSQPAELMPSLLNCTDLLVLPSRVEGLPLVAAEALACGANVVASDVGGTAEAVGKENTFPLVDGFIDRLSQRGAQMLCEKIEQKLPDEISWDATARKENEYISNLQ
ncbi:MAG: glycosyltransferase [Muribaculaceae bacterium]|nr:glycosyltransferase [Muribaculaceae bacterium]